VDKTLRIASPEHEIKRNYRIAGNFCRTLFSEMSGIFQNFFTKWHFEVFKPVAKKEKDNQKF